MSAKSKVVTTAEPMKIEDKPHKKSGETSTTVERTVVPVEQSPVEKSDSLLSEQTTSKVEPTKNDKEIGGRDGPDPTRYGDWEMNGRCIDF